MLKSCDIVSRALLLLAVAALAESLPPVLPQYLLLGALVDRLYHSPRAENAKINVTDEPYFGTYILCNYLPFSKADKGAQGGPQQHETPKHSPTDISKRK